MMTGNEPGSSTGNLTSSNCRCFKRAGMSADEIECIEEGGTEPTIALLRCLAAALDADVHLTAGHDLGSVWFEPHAA
jgi:transcriptional regulator with XRE-family HTH domain